MSLTSMRRRVLEAIVTRLQAITANNVDFETDAGQLVYVGEPQALGESDPSQAIAIVIGDDEPQSQTAGSMLITTPFEICALAQVAPEDPWTPVEAVLADIKRAMEVADQSFGGLVANAKRGSTRVMAREPGATTSGLAITYRLTWKEGWGLP